MENPLANKLKWKKDGRTFGWGASPDGDWKIILLTAIIFAIFVSGWDLFTYFKVKSGELSHGEETAGPELPTLNRANLKQAVEYYQNKAREFEKIKNGTSTTTAVSDPSI